MTKAKLLKNHVLRNKLESDISNPAGNISKEIAEQDLNGETGGALPVITVTTVQPITNNTACYICNPVLTIVTKCNL